MKSPKVSIIIPVYNAEKTIGSVVSKALRQSHSSVEVVLIDDGSTDGSLAEISKAISGDARAVVISQENAGPGAARNAGLDAATGRYITFIDADDDFNEDLVKELVDAIESVDADLSMCGMRVNGAPQFAQPTFVEGRGNVVKYSLRSLLTRNLLYGPYCKLFRKEIIDQFYIRFNTAMRYGEDTVFVIDYLKRASSLANIDSILYSYKYLLNGLAGTNFTSISSRKARDEVLSQYVKINPTITVLIYYFLVRARWLMSYVKSILIKMAA